MVNGNTILKQVLLFWFVFLFFVIESKSQCTAVIGIGSGSSLKGCETLSVQFIDSSTTLLHSYTWDFGDGHTSGVQNPSHPYFAGHIGDTSYVAKLTIICGSPPPTYTSTATDTIKVYK